MGVAAVALLARRDYGSAELTALLRDKGFAASAVHAVVSDLIEHRFIDDARYANHRTSYQAERLQDAGVAVEAPVHGQGERAEDAEA